MFHRTKNKLSSYKLWRTFTFGWTISLISKQMCGCVFTTSSLLYSYSPRDCSPSSSPQRLFNHAACVNELCLMYSCVGRTEGNRSDQINMRTLSLLSLSDLLRWFKWKSSLVFMLLQMSVNTHTHTHSERHTRRQTVGCLVSTLSADLFDTCPFTWLSTFTHAYYLCKCIAMQLSCMNFNMLCHFVWETLTVKWASAGH